jgi:hypothetical protein
VKKYAVCFVLTLLMVSGCTSPIKQGVTKDKPLKETALTDVVAISKAKEKAWIKQFPNSPTKIEGVIYGGGPSPGIQVPGEFETKVEKDGENYFIVTFTESWNGNYSSQTGTMRSHSFKYKVTSSDVQLISDSGDFPPQLIK